MSIFQKFAASSKELGNIKALAACAMLLALRIVLGIFANFSLAFIPLPVIKISLAFLPVMLTAYMFGPVCAGIIAGAGDLFSYLLAPTALGFNPAITACYILEGIIYGACLYKTELKLSTVILSKALDMALCTVTLHSYVLQLLFFNTTPIYWIILYRAAVLAPLAVLETALIMLIKRPLVNIQRQLHT